MYAITVNMDLSLLKSEFSNVPKSIEEKIGRNLHLQENHPVCIIKNRIYDYFKSLEGYTFNIHDNFNPIVNVAENFDKLRIPPDHPARSKSDTYYVSEELVLRTQTSSHQNELFAKGVTNYLVTGDVYRKDEIDHSHYPVFHQMEGVAAVPEGHDPVKELKKVLSGLVEHLFPGCEYRFNKDYFPFTEPSLEVEVKYKDDWMEILGCGITHQEILDRNNINVKCWAFGLGLDRLAMLFFKIPDIRYLWSTDEKFLSQFKAGEITEFTPYSNLDPVVKDISFWIENEDVTGDDKKFSWNKLNSFYEFLREVSNDLLEQVELLDTFYHPKKERYSHTFRLTFSPTHTMDDPGELTKQCNSYMLQLRDKVNEKFGVELR